MSSKTETEREFATDFLSFVNGSPSQFHAVEQSKQRLLAAGYTQISERVDSDWNLKPGGKYFITRNYSTIMAFAVGAKYRPGNGFVIIGAHTDSPVPKLKPKSKAGNAGYLQLGVQLYGGGLWNTWFDRDLSLAGKVIVASGDGFETRLVSIQRPILRIPNLAIHLGREVDSQGFNPNKENNIVPILATALKEQLSRSAAPAQAGASAAASSSPSASASPAAGAGTAGTGAYFEEDHHPVLLQLVAEELKLPVSAIRDFELCLYDTQPAQLGGAFEEFIFSRALDNLMMSFVGLRSLIATSSDASLADETMVRVLALYDNEEVGSSTDRGAASVMSQRVLQRINGGEDQFDAAVSRSYLVSADMAHAVHPNYQEKHESKHRPELHKGLVLKENANQRYATTAVTAFYLLELARRNNLPMQRFVVRNDSACGSTIGPILATGLGMRTVDVGVPQLAMHSVREMCGTGDAFTSYQLFTQLYENFAKMDAVCKFDE